MSIDEHEKSLDLDSIKSAAEQGNAYAQFRLGWNYYIGNGVAPNRMESLKWYRKAAEQGYREAQDILEIIEANKVTTQYEKVLDTEGELEHRTKITIRKLMIPAVVVFLFVLLGLFFLNSDIGFYSFHGKSREESDGIQQRVGIIEKESQATTRENGDSIATNRTDTERGDEKQLIEPNTISLKQSQKANALPIGDTDHLIEPNNVSVKEVKDVNLSEINNQNVVVKPATSENAIRKAFWEYVTLRANEWLQNENEPNQPVNQ